MMMRTFGLVLMVCGVVTSVPADQPVRSATLAKQLTAALMQQRLEAVAAQYPDEPDRFVAALFFPGAQLLVVSARYVSPPLLQSRLAHKEYRDIYLDLQGSPISTNRVFFQDMKADGLCAGRDQTADILYDDSATPKIFDGDWRKHSLSEQAYEHQLTTADEQYSRLLEILLAQLRGN